MSITQGGATTVTAGGVPVRQGGIVNAQADDINVSMGGVVLARAERVSVEMGGMGLALAREAHLTQGAVRSVIAKDVQVDQSLVGTVLAGRVRFERPSAIFLLIAGRVEGPVRAMLDWRGAIAFGAAFGAVVGLLRRRRLAVAACGGAAGSPRWLAIYSPPPIDVAHNQESPARDRSHRARSRDRGPRGRRASLGRGRASGTGRRCGPGRGSAGTA